ncbi:MAG: hypothetical protein HDR09_13070 [Lachnospiraceae bacterium]|nr:hypothetical protein [Lachnospiraceae bacterium]
MVETYMKLKIFFEYIAPIGLLVGIAMMWIGWFLVAQISYKRRKRRERKNGKVRKEDDAV